MKSIVKLSSSLLSGALLVVICITLYSFKKGNCAKDEMTTEVIDRLKKFTLIQSYPFNMKKKKKSEEIERKVQLITLNRGVRYKFYTVRNEDYEGLPILAIYNNEKMEFLLGTTYNANLKKFYNELEFECKTTGNYCLAFSFQEGLEGCAIGVFSSLVKD